MGSGRFLYSNLITTETIITVSSLRTGLVTAALKNGTGSATLSPSGNYSGTTDLEYIVEIDSIAGGAEVAQATYKWSDGGGTWDATGVTTSASATLLNNGIYVAFTTGSGADFVVGDKWYFKGINLFNAGQMIDLERDHRYRSASLGAPNTITIDLGSGQEVKALVLMDHNFTSASTLLLEADSAATFDSGGGATAEFSESVTWASEKILHYLSAATTKRYWRLSVTDASNPDGYIEIGELFLGSYLELSRNYANGFSQEIALLMDKTVNAYGVQRRRFYNQQSTFEFDFNVMPMADVASLKGLLTTIASRSTGQIKPFYFNADSAVTADFWMVEIEALPVQHRTRTFYDMPLILTEVTTGI